MAIQEELRVRFPSDELEDLYEEEPRRRSWAAIASVVLALALIFVAYQWNQAAGREQQLLSQVGALRAEAETLRSGAEEAKQRAEALKEQVAALTADKGELARRVATLETSDRGRLAAARGTRDRRAVSSGSTTAREPATRVVIKRRR